MTIERVSRMQKKGQVTVPLEYRNRLGLKEGDLVVFTETDEGIILQSRRARATELMDRIGQILAEDGVTLEELLEAAQATRRANSQKRHIPAATGHDVA